MAVYVVACDLHVDGDGHDYAALGKALAGYDSEQILSSTYLVDSHADAETLHDGYFFLERVPPGQYKVRIDPEQAKKLGIQLLKDVTVTAGPDGGLVGDVDVRIVRGAAIAAR